MSQWPSHARDNSSSLAATLFTSVDPVSLPFDLFDYRRVFCCKHLVLCYHWISQTMYRSVNGQTYCLGRESPCSQWELWRMGAFQESRKAEPEIQFVWHRCGKGRCGVQDIQSSITFLSPFWCYPTNLNLLLLMCEQSCAKEMGLFLWYASCLFGVNKSQWGHPLSGQCHFPLSSPSSVDLEQSPGASAVP